MARRHRRRRNPLSRGWKIALSVFAGVVTAGAIGFALVERRRLRELSEAFRAALPEEIRLPRPDFAVKLPTDPEDYVVLTEVVCECTDQWIAEGQAVEDVEALLLEVQRCAAEKLVPEFPWPPVSGDHATVHALWGALGYEVARHLTLSLCPAAPPVPAAPKKNPRAPARRRWRRLR